MLIDGVISIPSLYCHAKDRAFEIATGRQVIYGAQCLRGTISPIKMFVAACLSCSIQCSCGQASPSLQLTRRTISQQDVFQVPARDTVFWTDQSSRDALSGLQFSQMPVCACRSGACWHPCPIGGAPDQFGFWRPDRCRPLQWHSQAQWCCLNPAAPLQSHCIATAA